MKKIQTLLAFASFTIGAFSTHAAISYDFTGNNDFDGETVLTFPLVDTDNGNSTTMTLTAGGGTFNSNAGDFGIDSGTGTNDFIDGTSESITITFATDILFNFIDLGGVGSDSSDGANLTIDATSIDLFTGVSDFNGTQDIYTPASPISLTAGNAIVLTGSSSTSDFDLEVLNFTVVPEPNTFALLAGFFALASVMYRRRELE